MLGTSQAYRFDNIESALDDFSKGEFLIVMDNEDRENEGDLIIAAQDVTPEKMAFLIRYSSGYVCAPTTSERLEQLEIPMMVPKNTDPLRTAYGVSIDFKYGTTTGISAADRAKTANALADPSITNGDDFNKPGHLLPLKARPNGVLERQGHTEAAVDLCKLSNKNPTAIICELVNDDGTMKRREDCFEFAQQHNIKMITIENLVQYIKSTTNQS